MTNESPHRVASAAGAEGSIKQNQFASPPSNIQAPGAAALARQSAESFLAALDPHAERFTFQTFTDCTRKREEQKAKGGRDPLACVLHGSLYDYWAELGHLSAAGAGIFVVINETDFHGRTANNIVRVRSYFVDFDGADLANLKRLALRPHLVTQTSNGRYHAYWLVHDAALDRFRNTQKRLARLMEGDKTVCDLPRVMRLPGFPHQKDPARLFLVTGETVEIAPPYREEEFQTALGWVEKGHLNLAKPRAASQGAALAQANDIEKILGKKPDYLIQPPGRKRLADLVIAALGLPPPDMERGFPDGSRTHELTRRAGWCLGKNGGDMTEDEAVSACLEWNQCNTPPLTDEKVRLTVASIAKAESKKRQAADGTTGSGPSEQAGEDTISQSSSDKNLIGELANLSIVAYGRRRKDAAKQFGIGVIALDKAVARRRTELEGEATAQPLFPHWTVEQWPEPVDGDALILELVRRIQSHVVISSEAALTVALWIIVTWVHAEVAIHSPILMVTSAEAECGKSTLLGLVGFLVWRALASVGISPAALYRSIEKWGLTLIIDEADVVFVQNEDLRSVVNSGWTRGQGVLRCEGDDHELKLFPTFCPKAVGLKGKKLPDTTASRAIVIELKRKLAGEKVADFRHVDDYGLQVLRQQLLRWANDNVGKLLNASPTLPHGFANRVAANWHLPLAIADAAGGCWPDKAREAAAVIAKAKATHDASIGIQLLEDIRAVFNNLGADCMFSKTLIDKLIGDSEKPWGEYNHSKPITQKQLANRLRAYGIMSETVWIDGKSAKGYKRTVFEDTWTRYLSA